MAKNKDEFLKEFDKAHGNISVACTNFGMYNSTYFDWYNNDPDFKAKADAIKEKRKDFIESALDKKIEEGDTTAIIFAAKTQCKDRGYSEKIEFEGKQQTEISVAKVNVGKLPDDLLFQMVEALDNAENHNE